MPVDFEPLFSASPPLFKPFAHTFADYRYATGPFATANSTFGGRRMPGKMSFGCPLRPILIVRSDGGGTTLTNGCGCRPAHDDVDDTYESAFASPPLSPTGDDCPSGIGGRSKKRVVFADDRGLALEHVKVMTEPSDCPPRWQDDFFEHVTRGATAAVDVDRWEPVFAQPASDYVEFRRKLERDCVCLENVIVREGDESVSGTIKVKNVTYCKSVSVRVSCDRWKGHEDYPCAYVPSGTEGTSLYDLYDTFTFTFPIAPGAAKFGCVEFCVRYRCGETEYWDNNGGVNYKLQARPACPAGGCDSTAAFPLVKFEDAFTARINSWTEFASWNHLVNDTPYW